ncbi:MAG: DUF6092 family protein [Acidimicrobiales bacterium]
MSKLNIGLSDEETLELFAYLVTSAQCCLTEPPDYGTFRLISAAERLARVWQSKSESEWSEFLDTFATRAPGETAWIWTDTQRYADYLAECAEAVGREIKRRGDEDSDEDES